LTHDQGSLEHPSVLTHDQGSLEHPLVLNRSSLTPIERQRCPTEEEFDDAIASWDIVKHCEEPYLSSLISGTKTVEGRVNKGVWSTLEKGDVLCLYNEQHSTPTRFRVLGRTKAKDFGILYDWFGKALLPNASHSEEARRIYGRWFDEVQIATYGVVGIEVEKISDL
jgi:ASC-1-like (ASCH) protein